MWKDWLNGILGILIVFLVYIGIPSSIKNVLLIVLGLVVAVLSFWSGVTFKVEREISKFEDTKDKLSNNGIGNKE